ncbi:MAG: lipoprotein [Succinivibrio sp.]
MKQILCFVLVAAGIAIAGCGIKGKLYIEDEPVDTQSVQENQVQE